MTNEVTSQELMEARVARDRIRRQAREAHYARYFGELAEPLVVHSTDVQAVHIDVYPCPPSDTRCCWTLVTGGMSDLPQNVPSGCGVVSSRTEMLMYASQPEDWVFGVLKYLAEYPFAQNTFFHWDHTLANGAPLAEAYPELTSIVFLPPSLEDPGLGDLHLDGDRVCFLWAVPISERERQYAIRNGCEALQMVLESEGLGYVVDFSRESVA